MIRCGSCAQPITGWAWFHQRLRLYVHDDPTCQANLAGEDVRRQCMSRVNVPPVGPVDLPWPAPPPGSPYAQMWITELTEDQRKALPAHYHRPFFDALSTPSAWVCEVCWGDGWSTQWPCLPARDGGIELAKSLNLGFVS